MAYLPGNSHIWQPLRISLAIPAGGFNADATSSFGNLILEQQYAEP